MAASSVRSTSTTETCHMASKKRGRLSCARARTRTARSQPHTRDRTCARRCDGMLKCKSSMHENAPAAKGSCARSVMPAIVRAGDSKNARGCARACESAGMCVCVS
eukprot:3087848-Pleurochrysis_carterae.AAC.1